MKKKVVVIGGTGTIGKAIVSKLETIHDVITVGHSGGDYQVDISSTDSIERLYSNIGKVDAVVIATGKLIFKPVLNMTHKDYLFGLESKLLGQVNIVLQGLKHINNNGSFTLTSGILNRAHIAGGSSAAMVNGALDSFVKAASLEMPPTIRINCVSPTVVEESMPVYQDYFHGFKPASADEVAMAYFRSVDGIQTGEVFQVGYC